MKITTINELAKASLPIPDATWGDDEGSERQIEAQNKLFDTLKETLPTKDYERILSWCEKATIDEIAEVAASELRKFFSAKVSDLVQLSNEIEWEANQRTLDRFVTKNLSEHRLRSYSFIKSQHPCFEEDWEKTETEEFTDNYKVWNDTCIQYIEEELADSVLDFWKIEFKRDENGYPYLFSEDKTGAAIIDAIQEGEAPRNRDWLSAHDDVEKAFQTHA
tara:strand:- start:108 stop:767 length:660 start_codon:yes stop_codon:yes gene_type:complete